MLILEQGPYFLWMLKGNLGDLGFLARLILCQVKLEQEVHQQCLTELDVHLAIFHQVAAPGSVAFRFMSGAGRGTEGLGVGTLVGDVEAAQAVISVLRKAAEAEDNRADGRRAIPAIQNAISGTYSGTTNLPAVFSTISATLTPGARSLRMKAPFSISR